MEIEIEGGYGWAERPPTAFRKLGLVGREGYEFVTIPEMIETTGFVVP
jgi:hypothetical protein